MTKNNILIIYIHIMSGGTRIHGIVDSYDDMTPIPVISYNPTNNALVINNPAQANEGIASTEGETLDFNSPTLV